MYSTSDFKKGLKILIDDQPYSIVDFQHVKPGKGNQFTRTKLRRSKQQFSTKCKGIYWNNSNIIV